MVESDSAKVFAGVREKLFVVQLLYMNTYCKVLVPLNKAAGGWRRLSASHMYL